MDRYFIGGYILLSALLLSPGFQHALLFEALYKVSEGMFTFVYPTEILNEFSKGIVLDNHHVFLAKLRIVNLMMNTVSHLLLRKSLDVTTKTAFFFSLSVSYILSSFIMLFAHAGAFLTHSHLLYSAIPTIMWSVVMGTHLLSTGNRVNTQVRTNDINYFLALDVALNALIGVADIVHPDMMTRFQELNLDDLHVYLYRINGAVSLGNACMAWVALRFRFTDEKRIVLIGRLMGCLGSLMVLFTHVPFSMLKITLSTQLFTLRIVLLALPSIIGCLRADTGALWLVQMLRHFVSEGRRLFYTQCYVGFDDGGSGMAGGFLLTLQQAQEMVMTRLA